MKTLVLVSIHVGPLVAVYGNEGSVVKGPLQTLDNRLIVYKGVMHYPLRTAARHLRTSRNAMFVRSVVLLSVNQRPLKHALYSWHE